MAAPVGPFKFTPSSLWIPSGVKTIPLVLSADVDLTASAGQTGGYCARRLMVGATAGNVVFYDITGAGPFTQAVLANTVFEQSISGIVQSGTTAVNLSAVL